MATQKIYEMVTEKIIVAIKDAIAAAEKTGKNPIVPWQRPWFNTGMPCNLISKKPYRGINAFLLSMMGFSSPYFLSFKQAKDLGGNIKKGEKGMPVIFWKWLDKKEDGEEKDGEKKAKKGKIPFLRYYTVFNVAQTEGIPENKIPKTETRQFNPIAEGDKIIANMPNRPEITHGEARAYYRPAADIINMPPKDFFKSDSEYYSTAFHEMAHSTGHTSRLNRKEVMDGNSFGSHDYSIEELVAEMTAVFLCNEIGIEATFDNSLSYLKSWLGKLQDDVKMLVIAGGRAQKASDYILGENNETTAPETEETENNGEE